MGNRLADNDNLTTKSFPFFIIQVRKSFFQELGIYDNETFIRQIYYDYIEGKASQSEHLHRKTDSTKIAFHEKLLKEYLERMNETAVAEKSINWVTHQKCKDMFILSKVGRLLHMRTGTVLNDVLQTVSSQYVFFFAG